MYGSICNNSFFSCYRGKVCVKFWSSYTRLPVLKLNISQELYENGVKTTEYPCNDEEMLILTTVKMMMWWVQEASSEMRTVVLFIVLTKVQTKICFLSVSPKLLLHPILRYHSPFPAKKDSDVPCFHLNETLSSPPSHTHHPLLYYLI